ASAKPEPAPGEVVVPPDVEVPAAQVLVPTQAIDEPIVAGMLHPEAELDEDQPLAVAASEQEVAQAVLLIGEFAGEVEERHQQNLVRVVGVEEEVGWRRPSSSRLERP